MTDCCTYVCQSHGYFGSQRGIFIPAISPGCLISIFGTGLAPSLDNAGSVPLPTNLMNTSIEIGEFAVSERTQYNAMEPVATLQVAYKTV